VDNEVVGKSILLAVSDTYKLRRVTQAAVTDPISEASIKLSATFSRESVTYLRRH